MRAALGFLTILGGAADPDLRAARWFVPVGLLLGATLGAAWWAADHVWPPTLAAVLVVALDAGLTGMLHLDGLADSGDGLLAPMDRPRRLQVMRDPSIGAFGIVVVLTVLLLRVTALASIAPDVLLLAGLWGASRGAMAVALASLPYARAEGGLASGFGGSARQRPVLRSATAVPTASAVGTLAALGVVAVAGGIPAGPVAAAALAGGSLAVLLLAVRRLGGFTGDVLGAAGVIGETCGLLALAARW